jgi:hypothetical protein
VLQKFEKTFKPILNVESTKECMNILLLIDAIFQLWQNIFLEWERCNILDGSGNMLACLSKLIGKHVFDCLVNLMEKQLKKLARGLLSRIITIKERLIKGRRPNLKSMYKELWRTMQSRQFSWTFSKKNLNFLKKSSYYFIMVYV